MPQGQWVIFYSRQGSEQETVSLSLGLCRCSQCWERVGLGCGKGKDFINGRLEYWYSGRSVTANRQGGTIHRTWIVGSKKVYFFVQRAMNA